MTNRHSANCSLISRVASDLLRNDVSRLMKEPKDIRMHLYAFSI